MPQRRLAAALALTACSFALPTPGEGNTIQIQLTPAGAFKPSDGREMKVPAWRIDSEIASRVIERFNQRTNPAVVDYEHQTLLSQDNGQPAPAAGWMRTIEWREGSGLWATVELTTRAADFIRQGEYKFVSPVLAYDDKTGEVLGILHAALTNAPAIDGMQPLELRAAASFGFTHDTSEEEPMNKLLVALIAALALDPNTTEDQAVAACSGLKHKLDAFNGMRKEVGAEEVTDAATATASIAACATLKQKAAATGTGEPDPTKYVPVSVVEAIKFDLAALKKQLTTDEVTKLVDEGLADGRLLEAQKDWATKLGTANLVALKDYLAGAQPIAALRKSQTDGNPPEGGKDENGLTHAELAICNATGVDPKDFVKQKGAAA